MVHQRGLSALYEFCDKKSVGGRVKREVTPNQ